MGGSVATNALNLNAYHLLTSVPREELVQFKVQGRHAGHVTRSTPSKPVQNAVIVRSKGWMLESRWKPPPPRRQKLRAKFRRIFHWRARWRQKTLRKVRATPKRCDVTEDDFDDDCDSWEEEGIPEVSSDPEEETSQENSNCIRTPTIPARVNISMTSREDSDYFPHDEIDEARDSFSNTRITTKIPRHFPRQFSIEFSEQQDEHSLRMFPKVKKHGVVRVRNLPRGVPLRPVNMHKEEQQAALLSIERLTESSGSSRDSYEELPRKVSPRSAASVQSAAKCMFKEETSPVSSTRSSGTAPKWNGFRLADANDNHLKVSRGMSTAECKASQAFSTSARKHAPKEPTGVSEDGKLARAVSMYDDDFISFSCESRNQKGIFKLSSKHEKGSDRKAVKNAGSKNQNIIRRLFVKKDG
eukprot:Plantae.Rhodophyta-Hildenbrandia_rubra.ctg2653.p1 GENE.Plantae.Rhodophyta-Hildenbrandia_rubra.ctg2653~~Plantae.Rhodophyta-Hildenbrandia_rubra.ctg2653.p1  ORF type:complete len:414 (-),score=53.58 Plantae.Rhodophyta-Hildenbrandia_rubra.ctg2653:637-1878(-)